MFSFNKIETIEVGFYSLYAWLCYSQITAIKLFSALEAEPTEPEVVGVNDMPVAGEVVLKVWGQVPNNKRGIRRNWIRGRPRKHLPLAAILQQGVTKTDVDGTGIDKKNITVTLQDAGSNVVVTMQGEVSLPSTENLGKGSLCVSSGLKQEENVAQGIIGANFKPGEIIVIGNDEGKNTLFTDSEVKLDITSNVNVSPKSDERLLSSNAKILKMCNYCLRLFPGPVLLYRHVKIQYLCGAAFFLQFIQWVNGYLTP